ncbi:MAG: UDP-glucose 4-epimerase GalE [Pelagibacteraceae bacterium TMED232]|nr:MAG: UDP-glucose 4-epimerase GalE [Pelagibacteraceae bacterium TMED232]|tara:strand:- start:203 stop:1234 length:1032 start_codon:yes stop_codon:yes gene_type:complete
MDPTTGHQYQKPNIKGVTKAVLVTGGAGYVGSHTCKLLAKNGYVPITIDRHFREGLKTFGPCHDLHLPQEVDRLDEIIKRYNITSCIHFAGSTSVPESVENPSLYYKNNFILTLSLVDKLIECGVKTFVYSSSAATYGDPGLKMVKESDQADPISAYGASKIMIEMMCKDYMTAYGLSSVGLRYFNAAGADPEAEVGELRQKETHIVPLAIEAARQGKTFKMFGNKYPTKDGSCVRDYVHVMDLADAHIKALNYASSSLRSDVFNLGSGAPASNIELLDAVQKHTGKMNIDILGNRPGDPAFLVADITKAKEILGWEPTQSSIDNVVATAVKWYNNIHKKEIQ